MDQSKKISFYYLKLKSGKFRLMKRIEQPATIYEIVGEADDEEEAERKVSYLTLCNENE